MRIVNNKKKDYDKHNPLLLYGVPRVTRTPSLLLRRQLHFPVMLWRHEFILALFHAKMIKNFNFS